MGEIVSTKRVDGSTKSKKEIEQETRLLLNQYRRSNLLLQDRIYDIQMNVLPQKDQVIKEQKEQILDLCKDLEELKNKKNKSWLFN